MIYEVEGDIMLTRAQVIAHGVATGDAMTRGFSRKLNERFPAMVQQYREWCEETNPEPGEIWLWSDSDEIQILNLITHEGDKDDPTRAGRPNKIALNRGLRRMAKLTVDERIKSVAMPKVGAGEFGLDWSEVRGMMDSQLGELLIPIFLYTVELDGQVASEPGM